MRALVFAFLLSACGDPIVDSNVGLVEEVTSLLPPTTTPIDEIWILSNVLNSTESEDYLVELMNGLRYHENFSPSAVSLLRESYISASLSEKIRDPLNQETA